MRKLQYGVDIHRLSAEKKNIVPVLFTEHQFQLIEKKFSGKKLSSSERNEFSRAVSRKMLAVYSLMGKSDESVAVYGAERMITNSRERGVKGFVVSTRNKTMKQFLYKKGFSLFGDFGSGEGYYLMV